MSSDEDQPGQSSPLLDKQTDESAELENSWERVDCYDDRNCKSIKNNFETIDSEDDIDIESSLKRKFENVDIKSVKNTAKKSKVSPIKSEDEPDTNDNEDDESTDEYSEESENECDDNDLSSEDDENVAGEEDEQNKDDDDDEEDEEEEDTEEIIPSADYDSDVSTDESERCPICLNRFLDQDVGTPESCDHNFCLECIQEWASNVNTCPVDRQVFHLILGRHSLDDIIFKKFPVDDRQAKDGDEDADETYCEICGRSDREDRLLLCDGCDLGTET